MPQLNREHSNQTSQLNQELSPLSLHNFILTQQLNERDILTVSGSQALYDLTQELITISGSCSIVSDHIACKAQAGVFDMKAHKLSLHGDVETIIC